MVMQTSFRGIYGQLGKRDSRGRLLPRGGKKRKSTRKYGPSTKKGQVRKTARRAYMPKKSTKKRRRGRPASLPKTKKLTLKGKKKSFTRKSTHRTKAAAKKATGTGYYTRVVKGGSRYGVYRRKK